MDKSYVGKTGWVFEFNHITFFVTTFAPCYPENHSRYSFESTECYVLLQPEISFAQYDLDQDTPFTDWDNPKTPREKIRSAFRMAGRGYPIRDTVRYPMAHDIIRPLEYDGDVVQWWKRAINHLDTSNILQVKHRYRTQSASS